MDSEGIVENRLVVRHGGETFGQNESDQGQLNDLLIVIRNVKKLLEDHFDPLITIDSIDALQNRRIPRNVGVGFRHSVGFGVVGQRAVDAEKRQKIELDQCHSIIDIQLIEFGNLFEECQQTNKLHWMAVDLLQERHGVHRRIPGQTLASFEDEPLDEEEAKVDLPNSMRRW